MNLHGGKIAFQRNGSSQFGNCTPERPNVKRVVVDLQVNQQLRALEVAGGDTHVVLLAEVVVLGEAPIDQAQFAVRVVNHYVVGLDVAVHNAFRVAEVEGFQHFKHVEADVKVSECFIESAEILVTSVHELHYQCWGFGHWVSNNIEQVNNVDATLQSLQNLDLPPNLSLLHYKREM